MKGAVAYDDPAKDAWRGWKWNMIALAACGFNKRIPPSEKYRRLCTKTVLYLVGPNDHDRKRALARGFSNHNLIAIDLVQDRVEEVRRAGGLAICGSLQQVILNWPVDWPIDVVDADLCGGLTKDVMGLPWILMVSPAMHPETVLSLNMLRGRDPDSNEVRRPFKSCGNPLTSRALNWMVHLKMVVDAVSGRKPCRKTTDDFFHERLGDVSTYRSKTSGQWFDSVVHRWGMQASLNGLLSEEIKQIRMEMSKGLSKPCAFDDEIRHRIAALRAVRTMKMRAA